VDDWSCHLFVADRTHYILVSNTKSLYSVVLYAKGITDESTFIDRVLSNLREFLSDDGQQFVYRTLIAPSAATVQFGKTIDRKVIGSMNELIAEATYFLVQEEMSPYEVGLRLNETPMSAIAPSKSERYGVPREAFRKMAGVMEGYSTGI
jgi:hypothetical protein